MTNIKEAAENYVSGPPTVDLLDKITVDLDISEEKRTTMDKRTGEEEEYTIKTVTVEGTKYRVPNSVLQQLKTHLEDNPELEHFKVKKTGEGMKTRYTVIPVK